MADSKSWKMIMTAQIDAMMAQLAALKVTVTSGLSEEHVSEDVFPDSDASDALPTFVDPEDDPDFELLEDDEGKVVKMTKREQAAARAALDFDLDQMKQERERAFAGAAFEQHGAGEIWGAFRLDGDVIWGAFNPSLR